MPSKVFISYRRDDTAGIAGRVYDRLEREFGRNNLFMDVDARRFGSNFVEIINEEVAKCDVLLAIIGRDWLDARDEDGNRRLDNPDDYVRIEISAAIKRDIPVIPILIDGTRVPKADQLPDDLKDLPLRSGLNVRNDSFHSDMDRLVLFLRERSETAEASRKAQEETARQVQQDEQRKRAEEAEIRQRAERAAEKPVQLTPLRIGRLEGRMKVDAAIIHGAPDGWFLPGNGKAEWFKDHEQGPEMVVIPAGSFTMGCPPGEKGFNHERPPHPVMFARPFAVGKFAVTFDEWDACIADGGCGGYRPSDQGWGRGRWPVINVNWDDANAYVAWVSKKTGKPYRLLADAEYEYAETAYPWGNEIGKNNANCNDCGSPWDGKQTAPVGSFAPNQFGLYDMAGNVWDWVEDCYYDTYHGAPSDGSAWITGDCSKRVIRGGGWRSHPGILRSASRIRYPTDYRSNNIGFRVARALTP
jgi:formylglycine-generating enzyme required for sulfatase activity